MSLSDIYNLGIGLIVVIFIIGLIPAFIAYSRNHAYRHIILILCLFGSWTGVLWIIAFIWSVWPSEKSLIDPVVGNVTGTGQRSTGHSIGEVQIDIDSTVNRVPANSVSLRDPSDTRECPVCAETIKAAAKICRFCRSPVEPLDAQNILGTSVHQIPTEPVSPPPLAAICPQCRGSITSTTEACTHCNAWLGSGSDLKPIVVNDLEPSFNKKIAEITTNETTHEISPKDSREVNKSSNKSLYYITVLILSLAIGIYLYRSDRSTTDSVDKVTTINAKRLLSDGSSYEGAWSHRGTDIDKGSPNGKGKITYKNGKTEEGVFTNGVLNGPVKRTLPNGEILSGQYKKVGINRKEHMFFSDRHMPSEKLFEFIDLAIDERFTCDNEAVDESAKNTACRYFKDVMNELNQRNWCLGARGEDPKSFEWHWCTTNSLRLSDFVSKIPTQRALPAPNNTPTPPIPATPDIGKRNAQLNEFFKLAIYKPDFKNIETTHPILFINGWAHVKCKDGQEIGISCFAKANNIIEIHWLPMGRLGGTIEEINIYQSHGQRLEYVNQPETLNYSHGKYVGDVMSGQAFGYGTYTSAKSGTIYTGQFFNDTFSGYGIMTWTNGSKYVGKWDKDVGISGVMTYPNGTTSSGTVRGGIFTPSSGQTNSPPPTPTSNLQQNIVWNHNNSSMKVVINNDAINIYYRQPRQVMIEAGAKPNDLLVNGTIRGTQITGTARIFAGGCGQFTYPVTGTITNNGNVINLNGQAPVVNRSNCQVTKYVPDPLSFNVIP